MQKQDHREFSAGQDADPLAVHAPESFVLVDDVDLGLPVPVLGCGHCTDVLEEGFNQCFGSVSF